MHLNSDSSGKDLTCLEPCPPIIDASAFGHPSLLFEYIPENVTKEGVVEKSFNYSEKEDKGKENDEEDVNSWILDGCCCGVEQVEKSNEINANAKFYSSTNFSHTDKPKTCNTNTCSCLSHSKGPIYDPDGHLISTNPYSSRTIFQRECSHLCKCSEDECTNQVVHWGVSRRLRVVKTASKGLGVIAVETIPVNTFVCEYTGEVFSRFLNVDANQESVDEKINKLKSEFNVEAIRPSPNHNYILTLSEYFSPSNTFKSLNDSIHITNNSSTDSQLTSSPINIKDEQTEKSNIMHNSKTAKHGEEHKDRYKVLQTSIDASRAGGVARLINHSCDPNMFMTLIRATSVVPRACLFALRDIQAGEELSYNYSGCLKEKTGGEQDEVHMLDGGGNGGGSSETFEGGNQQVLRAERTAGSPSKELSGKPCHCGAEGCKVYLPKGL